MWILVLEVKSGRESLDMNTIKIDRTGDIDKSINTDGAVDLLSACLPPLVPVS